MTVPSGDKVDIDYYPTVFSLGGRDFHLIWFSSEKDGFLTSDEGDTLLVFEDEGSMRAYAREKKIDLVDETSLYGDPAEVVLDGTVESCDRALNMWNILSDVSASVGGKFPGDSRQSDVQGLYEKLFYGCNLPAVRNGGEEYRPVWNDSEKFLLKNVLLEGRSILLNALSEVGELGDFESK